MNSCLLKGKIRACDLTQAEVANAIGVSPSSFSSKINCHAEFYLGEIKALKAVLKLTNEDITNIFFADEVS